MKMDNFISKFLTNVSINDGFLDGEYYFSSINKSVSISYQIINKISNSEDIVEFDNLENIFSKFTEFCNSKNYNNYINLISENIANKKKHNDEISIKNEFLRLYKSISLDYIVIIWTNDFWTDQYYKRNSDNKYRFVLRFIDTGNLDKHEIVAVIDIKKFKIKSIELESL